MRLKISWILMALLLFGLAGYALINLAVPAFRNPLVLNIFTHSPSVISMHRWLYKLSGLR
ncbi:hypothetical protein [Paraglaciecola arctica]|uniref:hypothetical protein n=1 Tax=Paraglaciecola arctica TaxID=1128911 RepID=UPI001C06F8B6|nr:hypothetical protein [Paraglaciecola arctica]MBU3003384.1 hypothetical protein [Paraglaciecola arctica]